MFCPECGAQIPDDGGFCPECGASLKGTVGGDTAAPSVATGNPSAAAADSSPAATADPSTAATTGQATAAWPPPSPQVVQTDVGGKIGVDKCPYCGSSDISLNPATGLLGCHFCHREFSEQADPLDYDISTLNGLVMGSGAKDIVADAAVMITLKCSGCGAEVVVNTAETAQARCHWCRSMLSINQQIPNGAIPDALIPFRLTKQQAQQRIEAFVGKRKFYAHPRFKAEFTTENIMGVYLPYMVIDINAHADLRGQGEHLVRKYSVGSGDDRETRYDADLYNLGRDFDFLVDDLTVEASTERMHQVAGVTTNNVINAILPFPLKETVRFNANYLRGFTSEKRDANREHLASLVDAQARDIARYYAKSDAGFYDRGIRWDSVDVKSKGQLWKSVYLPVWLYSFLETKSNGKKLLHYVACNAVTGETMGSVPLHVPKLVSISAVIEVIGVILGVGLTILLVL